MASVATCHKNSTLKAPESQPLGLLVCRNEHFRLSSSIAYIQLKYTIPNFQVYSEFSQPIHNDIDSLYRNDSPYMYIFSICVENRIVIRKIRHVFPFRRKPSRWHMFFILLNHFLSGFINILVIVIIVDRIAVCMYQYKFHFLLRRMLPLQILLKGMRFSFLPLNSRSCSSQPGYGHIIFFKRYRHIFRPSRRSLPVFAMVVLYRSSS